jgi:hypothetical protein
MSLILFIKKYFSNRKVFRTQKNTKILSLDQFQKKIKIERFRSGRNNESFSLILISSTKFENFIFPQSDKLNNIAMKLRNIDHMGWFDDRHLGILLPYTRKEGADRLLKRLWTNLEGFHKETLKCQIFTYPDRTNTSQKEDV